MSDDRKKVMDDYQQSLLDKKAHCLSQLDKKPAHGFKVGDVVTYTNEYGVSFSGNVIAGFTEPLYKGGGVVHLDKDAYWFPVPANSLKLDPSTPLTRRVMITLYKFFKGGK